MSKNDFAQYDLLELKKEIRKLVAGIGLEKVRYFFLMRKSMILMEDVEEVGDQIYLKSDKARQAAEMVDQISIEVIEKLISEDDFAQLIMKKIECTDLPETMQEEYLSGEREILNHIEKFESQSEKMVKKIDQVKQAIEEEKREIWQDFSVNKMNDLGKVLLGKELAEKIEKSCFLISDFGNATNASLKKKLSINRIAKCLTDKEQDIDDELEDLVFLEELVNIYKNGK